MQTPDPAAANDERVWVIMFEDAEVPAEVFSGYGAEDAARRRFSDVGKTYNCTLFSEVKDGDRVASPDRPAAPRPYQGDMQTCDGLYEFDLAQTIVRDPWPAMVSFEFAYGQTVIGGTMTVEDARELASLIGAAASAAEFANRQAKATKS